VNTPHPYRQVIAAEVRAAMGRANVNQASLADLIGMSRPALSDRLACRRAFTTDHLFAIGEALGVDPLSLMTPPKVTDGAA
jgi:transcriptional regulator with XRE-family HTH domain